MMKTAVLLIFLIGSLSATDFLGQPKQGEKDTHLNNQPIIGVLTQPSFHKSHPGDEYSYLASTYVKYLQSAGARVLPIQYDLPEADLKKIFSGINGLLLPGGRAPIWLNVENKDHLSPTAKTAQFLVNQALETNKNGQTFPVWGTCLGYEMIMAALTNDSKLLENFDSHNHSENLEILKEGSEIFKSIDPVLKAALKANPLIYLNHKHGLSQTKLEGEPILGKLFEVTSLSHTQGGEKFVASIEGKTLPFYGVQFHPEKSPYVFDPTVEVNNSPEAVDATFAFAKFVVSKARLNLHKFVEKDFQDKLLIDNYDPVKIPNYSMTCYFFKNLKPKSAYNATYTILENSTV